MAESRRLTELTAAIKASARLPAPPHVVALSGGADSAALAGLLVHGLGDSPRCVHIHHGLAGSDLLADAARAIATKLEVELDVIEVEVPEGPSPEAMARDVRYSALEEATSDNENLLLGHTRNDQAETVLLNLVRGSGIRGLAGIPYQRGPRIFRPLLDVKRDETREFATLCGLPFFDDPTNTDRAIRRNRVRLDLMPRLEDLNPNLVDALARTAAHLREDSEFLDHVAGALPEVHGHPARVATGMLIALDRPLRSRVIAKLVASARGEDGLTSAELARVEDVLEDRSAAAELEGGFSVKKSGPFLIVS